MGLALGVAVVTGCAEPTAAPAAGASKPPVTALAKASAAAPPFLVRDLWEAAAPNYWNWSGWSFTPAGDHLYFTNGTPDTGVELWKTDASTGGTALVKDLVPGVHSSEPTSLTELGGWLYFSAMSWSGSDSYVLWRTRGTPESTEYVRALGNNPHFITRMGDALYFIARGGFEAPWAYSLWRSDGTAEGTRPLKEVSTYGGTSANATAQVNGTLFFTGLDNAHGLELWKTDGTPEGTGLVKDILPGPSHAWLNQFLAVNGVALFWARDTLNGPSRLWRTDGTEEGTFRIMPFQLYPSGNSGTTPLTVVGGAAYFSAWDAEHGQELWRTDGTDSGTYPLDLVPGVKGSSPSQMTAFAGQLFFEARNEQAECMLWHSDGTMQGSGPVIDLSYDTGCAVGRDGSMLATPDGLYLLADQTGLSRELWKSDGTAEGTVRLTDSLPFMGSWDRLHTWMNGTLYFTARDGELWASDGTREGTRVLLRKTGNAASSDPKEAVSLKGTLFFAAAEGPSSEELWMSDGTPEGTELLTDLRPNTGAGRPFHLMPAGSQLFFLAGHWNNLYQGIWRTDGTRAGTRFVDSLWSYDESSIAVVGEELFYVRQSYDREDELWKSDGTPEGQVFLKRYPGLILGWNPEQFTPAGGRLFFVADTDTSREALWVSDGTPDGTRMLVNIGALGRQYGVITHVVAVGDDVFFFATIDGQGRTLWKSDGTVKGTVRVAAGGAYYEVNSTAVVDGTLYFIARDSGPHALWKSDGTAEGTVRVKALTASTQTAPGFLTALKGAVYFWAYDAEHGYELWRSDGTEAGTGMLKELTPGLVGAVATPGPLVALGPDGPLMFAASDGVSGMELWQTDGTAEGTVLAADLIPGYDSSSPRGLTVSGRHLFFSAWQKDTGVELWAMPRTVADTTPPELVCPDHQFVEATSPQGAKALYTRATATDDTDPSPGLFYSAERGQTFPLGDASITVTAADETGNRSSCRFDLTVRDTLPPTLECPPPQRAEAIGFDGASVWFPSPVASDLASVPRVRTSRPNGAMYPLGTTEVEVTATDGAGLVTTCRFPVQVVDTVAPLLTCPGPMTAEAISPEGAVVAFNSPGAYDVASIPTVAFSPASGSMLPVGRTPVKVTATDTSGNSAECTFSVEVLDTKPPRLTCPPRQRVTQTSEAGAIVRYPAVDAADTVSATRVEFSPQDGSLLPQGITDVTVSATDASGNTERCSFQVEVVAGASQPDDGTPDAGPREPLPRPPTVLPEASSGCGCTQTSGAPLAFLGLLVLGALAPRARARAPRH